MARSPSMRRRIDRVDFAGQAEQWGIQVTQEAVTQRDLLLDQAADLD